MAKYDRNRETLRIAKEFNNIAYSKQKGDENTLKSFNKLKENNKLYNEGKELGIIGASIDDKNELVMENDKMIPKKEHRNFKAGYIAGLKIFKEQLGEVNTESENKTR